MNRNCLILTCGLLIVGLYQCLAQTTTMAVPPNCVCPVMQNSMQQGGQGFPGAGPIGFGGKMQKHGICGNDGRNYTSPCDFINAKATNQNLGSRPCLFSNQQTSMLSTLQPNNNNSGNRQKTVCLTNGQTLTGTRMQFRQQMQANPSLAVRCKSACPCPALTCPSGRRGRH